MTTEETKIDSSRKTPDKYRWIKTAECALFFISAAVYFSSVSRELLDDYFILFAPTWELTVPWLIRLGIASFLLLLMFGVMAVLVRPPLLAAAVFVASMAFYVLILGGGNAIFIAAATVCFLLVGLNFSVVRQLENQVDFSVRPIGDKELMLCSILAILLAVPAGLGYVQDSTRRDYVVPPQITAMAREKTNDYVKTMVDAQHLPEPQRSLILKATQEQMGSWIGDAEKKAEPFRQYIPLGLGVAAYFTFQVLLFVVGLAAAAFLGPVLWLLKLTRFVRVSRHMRVVSRMTLKRKPIEVKSESEASA